MEEEMDSSAQSTALKNKRATTLHISLSVVIISVLVSWSNDFAAAAQNAVQAVGGDSRTSISLAEKIDRATDAFEATSDVEAEPANPGGQASVTGAVVP